jgi:hypothetical protein
LICVENSNVSLVDNYFLENNGRLILIQQNTDVKNRFKPKLSIKNAKIPLKRHSTILNSERTFSKGITLANEFDEICRMRSRSGQRRRYYNDNNNTIMYSFQQKQNNSFNPSTKSYAL